MPSTMSTLPSRSLQRSSPQPISPRFPTELSPSYFPQFPIRPRCPCFHLAPSQRSSPQAISHGFPSVVRAPQASAHGVHISISLPPNGALPKLFPTVSCPSYSHGFPSVQHVHTSISLPPTRPPQAISHGFPSVHPVVASVSLPPRGKINETRTQASEMLVGKTFTQEKPLHRGTLHTELLHRQVFTHRGFCTRKLLHTTNFYTNKDVANIETRRTKKASWASGNVPHFMPKRSMEATNAAPCFAPTLATPLSTSAHLAQRKIPQPRPSSHACSIAQRLASIFRSLRRTLFRDNRIDEFVLKTRSATSSAFLVSLPPYTQLSPSYSMSWTHNFSGQSHCWKLFPKNQCHQLCIFASLPRCGAPPQLFPRFTVHPHASGASVSLPPAEIPQAISKLFPRVPLHLRPCLPSFLSSIPSFLPSFPLSFLPSFLPCSSGSSVSLPSRPKEARREPKHCQMLLGKKHHHLDYA